MLPFVTRSLESSLRYTCQLGNWLSSSTYKPHVAAYHSFTLVNKATENLVSANVDQFLSQPDNSSTPFW